jgi:hypothetical protein
MPGKTGEFRAQMAHRAGRSRNAMACHAYTSANSHQRLVSAPWAPSSSRKMRIVGCLPAESLGVGAQVIVGSEVAVRRVFARRFGNYGSSLGGTIGKGREPEVILKTDERRIILDLGLERKLTARSSAWDDTKVCLEGDKLGFGQARQVGAVPPAGQAAVGAAASRTLLPDGVGGASP